MYKLGSVYHLNEYQIYTPIRWNYTAPPTLLAYVGHGQENGCRHEGVLSIILFTFFLHRQVELYKSSIKLAVDFNARNFVETVIGCRKCLLTGIFNTHFVG